MWLNIPYVVSDAFEKTVKQLREMERMTWHVHDKVLIINENIEQQLEIATTGLTKSQQKLESEVMKKMELMKEYYDREIQGIKGSSNRNDDIIKELNDKMKFL